MLYVFDTNIVSLLLRSDEAVKKQYEKLEKTDVILGCPMVWYEIRRGLLARDAKKQMERFEALFNLFNWQDFTEADWSLAADLWAQRRLAGRPVEDADLMIAVFAFNRNAMLVTDNEKDFDGLPVKLENWKT